MKPSVQAYYLYSETDCSHLYPSASPKVGSLKQLLSWYAVSVFVAAIIIYL